MSDVKWSFKLEDHDVRTLVRALDYCMARAENTKDPEYVIDKHCRAECVVQWRRIRNELTAVAGDE